MAYRTRYQASGECPPAFSPAGPDYQRIPVFNHFPRRGPVERNTPALYQVGDRLLGYGGAGHPGPG